MIEATLASVSRPASGEIGPRDLTKSLALTARELAAKIEELLEGKLPKPLAEYTPDEVTPEATAERIVQGATAFFSIFAKQNPQLAGQDLLNAFMNTIRSGIKQG